MRMTADTASIAIFGFAAATVVHAVFAALLLRDPKFGVDNRLAAGAFVGAVLASVAWALASLGDQFSPYVRHPPRWPWPWTGCATGCGCCS